MLREYAAELKNYNFYQDFKKGHYIDAYDEHKWKVAQIKDFSRYGLRTTVQVHFDGYTNRYDQKYDLPCSHKLAPLRTHTLPYTGHTNLQPKREELTQKPAVMLKQTSKNLQSKEGVKALWINQYLRGQLFIAADYLITKRSYDNAKDVEQTINFIFGYIKEGGRILGESVQYLKDLQKENGYDVNLINVHPKIAIIHSNTQFLFVLNSLVGNKDMRTEIYKNFQRHFTSPASEILKKIKDIIIEQKIVSNCQKLLNFKMANGRGLPWSIKKQAAILLNFMIEGFVFPMPTDHRELIEIMDYMGYFSLKGLLGKQDEEKKTLQLVVSLILSGNFEGRLRGLNEMKKILDYPLRRKDSILLQINSKDLLSFLIDNKNFNSQIFKRSLPIFQFCFKNKLLTRKHITQILGLHKDKHQLQIKGFYSSLAEFASFLDNQTILSFFKEFTSILPIDESLVTLIKQYSVTAINKNLYFRQSFCKQGEQLGLTFYWSMITSQAIELSSELKYKTIEAFASLLGDLYYFSKQIEKYVSLAIKGIVNRKNLQFYFKVIHQTLKLSKQARISKSIDAVEKDVNIVDCVIDGLKNAHPSSQKMWESMFQFLEQVTYISKKKLTYNQARQFWKIKDCRKYFLKLLRKYRLRGDQQKSKQKIVCKQLPPQTARQLIDKLFLDPKQMDDYQIISLDLYQTVDELLMYFNNSTGLLQYNHKHTIRTKNPQKIVGLDFYLSIINSCKSQELVEKAIRRFIQIASRVIEVKNLEQVKLSNWNFILQKLGKLKKNVLLSYKILLEQLNGRMKSLTILEPDLVSLIVMNKQSGQKRLMSVPRSTSLWKFRHLIGEQFKIQGLGFDLSILSNSNIGSSFKQTNFEKQQDFSMALITLNKDGPSAFIVPTKNKHPHLQTLQNFYKMFSDSKGDELIDWLSKQEGREALNILNKLPFAKKVQQRINKLSFKDPNQILDSNSLFKLNYQLSIITKDKNPKFIIGMIQKGFIAHIMKILIAKKDNFTNYPECYSVLASLMTIFSDMIKFSKMAKNAIMINDGFLVQLLNSCCDKPNGDYVDFLVKCLSFLKDLSSNKEVLTMFKLRVGCVFETKTIDKVIENVLMVKSKEKVYEIVWEIAKNTSSQERLILILSKLVNFDILKEKQRCCKQLFDLVLYYVDKKMHPSLFENLKLLFKTIRKTQILQQNQQNQNELLIGYLSIILKFNKLMSTKQIFQDLISQKSQSFIDHIINDCLFNLQPSKLRFKSSLLRAMGFKFLNEYQFSTVDNRFASIIQQAIGMGQAWRRQQEWNISTVKQVSHKYTGLRNLAATCYINSLFQQLFFIQKFRNQIIGLDANSIDDKENIALQLQNIFGHMKFSESSVYNTASLCKKFILDGQPIDPRIQTDVDEFFHSLMDKLERNLGKIGKKDVINNIFGGELSNLIIGSECEHTSQRIQPFLSIRLEIKDKKSLEQALREFIKGQVLEGDNAYFCERCDAKVKAVKRVCLKTLPEILIVTLKRFEFDFQTMQKFKLNTYCSFPDVVNVLPYTRDGIDNDHQVEQIQYEYKLKGVVIHYGVSEAGHYTSYVQTEGQKWYYFDDEKINEFNIGQELANQCFGGIQQNPFGDDQQKKKNAYLLFYEKVKKVPSAKQSKIQLTETAIFKDIAKENTRNKLMNLLFEKNMQSYILQMARSGHNLKVFFKYLLIVFLRNSKKKQRLADFLSCAFQIFIKNRDISSWFLSQINEPFLNQFIFYTDIQTRNTMSNLILNAFLHNQDITIGGDVLDQLLPHVGRKNMYPLSKVFEVAVKINKQYQKHLKEINFAEIVYTTVRLKELKMKSQIETLINKTQNQFGTSASVYIERPIYDSIDLLQTIDKFKVNFVIQDLDILLKRVKKPKTQQSLSAIIAKKYQDLQQLSKLQPLLINYLTKQQFTIPQQYIFQFFITLIDQLAQIKDQLTSKRIDRLVLIYISAIRESLVGYRSELLLILGLFKLCFSNVDFRNRVSDEFNEKEGKKLLKQIKNWIKEVGTNLSYLLRTDKLGFWRKPVAYGIRYQTMTALIQNQDKINTQKFQSSLNSIVQKHSSALTSAEETFVKDQPVKYNRQTVKFIRSYGLLSQILCGDKIKIVLLQDLSKMEYF